MSPTGQLGHTCSSWEWLRVGLPLSASKGQPKVLPSPPALFSRAHYGLQLSIHTAHIPGGFSTFSLSRVNLCLHMFLLPLCPSLQFISAAT